MSEEFERHESQGTFGEPEDGDYNYTERSQTEVDEDDYRGTTRDDVEVDETGYRGTSRGVISREQPDVAPR